MVDSDCLFSRVEREREEKLKQESGREGPPRVLAGSTLAWINYRGILLLSLSLLLQPTFYTQLSTSSS
jgi:hypothetical protein